MPSPPCLNSPVPSSSSSSSECSSVVTSTKRARTPRKRPNQSYTEAAVLLSKVYPNIFTTANTLRRRHRYSPLSFRSVSPPPFLAAHLIEHDPSRSPVSCRFGSKPSPPSPLLAGFEEQGSPDYDVESILDEEVGIDSIMGSLSTESNVVSSVFSPIFGGLMGFGTGGGQDSITRQALRGAHRGEWWRASTMVEVKDIVPELDVLPKKKKKKKTTSKKKKKKKKKKSKRKMKKKEEVKDDSSSSLSSEGKLKSGLGLKLNYKHVVDAWSDRQFPFTFSPDDLARLAETDLTPDTEGGGAREGSVQRFREKRKTRLFSKKIRYQVRKVNADCMPRMKASVRITTLSVSVFEGSKNIMLQG